jgi:hypothetical protein
VSQLGSATWEWNGAAWTQLATSLPPYARGRGALVHDERRRQTLFAFERTWVLSTSPAAASAYGSACGAAPPTLLAFGAPRLGRADFALDVHTHANAPVPVVVALALQPGALPLPGGCTLQLASVDAAAFALANASGFASLRLGAPDDVRFRGLPVFAQAFALTAMGLQTSGGLRLQLGD